MARRVHEAVDRFAAGGPADVAKLGGSGGEWRIRVGSWRVRFRIDPEDGAIVVLRVLPRGRAYRD
jgi:mRNA interferase RelE/StbE